MVDSIRWWLAALAPTTAALVLCGVPGFDVLDYHACLVLGPVVGSAAAALTVESLRGRAPLGFGWVLRATWLSLPLLIMLANALRVPSCDVATGLVFYAIGPAAAAIVGAAMGCVAVRVAPARAGWVFAGMAILAALPSLWFFMRHPQAFGFHPLLGWIAGPLYEDAVAPGWPVFAYRLAELGVWLPLAAWSLDRRWRPRLCALIGLTGLVVMGLRAGPEGWLVSTAHVQGLLSVRVEVLASADVADAPLPALVLHLPRGEVFVRSRPALIEDARHRYRQLARFFGRSASAPIHVYVYPDAMRKRALMGAWRVEMAKPWLRQVHIVWPAFGASVLKHELAHVFAADDAPWPFRVPMRGGVLPDALLIEGMAVAAEWPVRDHLRPHDWAHAMLRLGLAPPVQDLLSPLGFFRYSGARSYAVAGSFMRWVADTHGRQALLTLYRTADAHAATGQSLQQLAAAWRTAMASASADVERFGGLERAAARFAAKGLFLRPCAVFTGRELARAAELRELGGFAAEARCLDALDRALQDSVAADRRDPTIRLLRATAHARAGQTETALELVQTLSEHGELVTAEQRAWADIRRGDLHAVAGNPQTARRRWRRAARRPVSWATRRAAQVRLGSLAAGLLLARPQSGRRWLEVVDEAMVSGRDPFVSYLWARAHLLDAEQADDVERVLVRTAASGDRQTDPLAMEAARLLSLLYARRGKCASNEDGGTWTPWRDDHRDRCELARVDRRE